MSAVVGQRVDRKAAQAGGGAIPASAKAKPEFFFMIAEQGWEFDVDSGHWLPRVKRHYMDPGVNGTTENMDPSQAYAEREKNGWTCVKPRDPRLGERYQNYVVSNPYAGVGVFCTSIFEEIDVSRGGRVRITRNDGDWFEFLTFLVTSGIVPQLDEFTKADLLRDKMATLRRKETRAANALEGSAAHRKLKEYREMYAAAKLAGCPAPTVPVETPKPKPKRQRRAKKTPPPAVEARP